MFSKLSYSLLTQISVVVINFSTLAILGRLITPQSFGVFAVLMAIQTILLPLIDFGLTPAYVKMEKVDGNVNNAFFTTNFALAIINSVAYVAASSFINEKDILYYALIFVFYIFFSSLSQQPLSILVRENNRKKIMFFNVSALILSSLIGIGMAFLDYGVYALLFKMLFNSLFLFCFLMFTLPTRYKLVKLKNVMDYKEELKFSSQILLSRIVNGFSLSFDKFLFKKYFGVESLGFYSKSFDLARFPDANISSAISSPFLSYIARKRSDEKHSLYFLFSCIIFFITGNLCLLIIVYGDWIIVFLLGSNWNTAGALLQMLGVWALGKVIHGVLILLYTNEKKMKKFIKLNTWGFSFNYFLVILALILGGDLNYVVKVFSLSNLIFWIFAFGISIYSFSGLIYLYKSIKFILLNALIILTVLFLIKSWCFQESEYKLLTVAGAYVIANLSSIIIMYALDNSIVNQIKILKEE